VRSNLKITLSFFLFVGFSVLCSAHIAPAPIPEDGMYGLRDLEDIAAKPITLYARPIREIHDDLWRLEREVKAVDQKIDPRNTTNFIVGKLGFYKSSGDRMESSTLALHDLFKLSKSPFVFDSAARRDDMEKICREGGIINPFSLDATPINFPVIKESVSHNFGGDRECVTTACEKFQRMQDAFTQAADVIPSRWQSFQKAQTLYAAHVGHFKKEEEVIARQLYLEFVDTDGPKGTSQQLQDLNKEEEEWKKARKKYKKTFDDLIGLFYHSEPRVLRLFTDLQMLSPSEEIFDAIVLHLHSTHNVCDHCRLQFANSSYLWLYENIISRFKNAKFFHIVVTWFEKPSKPVSFIKPATMIEISEGMAPIQDTSKYSAFTEKTNSFVTFVKLV
jgi:hypothetical protein